jgi:hypothetical protein
MATPVDPYAARAAQERLNAPGITLMILGILGILGAAAGVLINLLGLGGNLAGLTGGLGDGGEGPLNRYMSMMSGGIGIVLGLFNIVLSGVVAFGGMKMRSAEGYGLAMAAAIISIFPCTSPCCCLIGIPVGIWALVVLLDANVKACFR